MKRNRIILIVILVILCAAYIVLRLKRPEEQQKAVFELNLKQINTIEVFDMADTLKMAKIKGVWRLTDPVNWNVDTLRIASLFKDVLSAKYPKTPMGEGKESLKRFKITDAEALHLVVGDEKNTVHVLFSNMGNPYDYFRYAGSDKVYQIKSKVMTAYSADLQQWRSPIIVMYAEDELESIEVTHKKNTYTLTRKKYDWYFKDAKNDFKIPLANLAIMKVVNILANMDTYVFVDGGDKETLDKFKTPDCVVTVQLTDKTSHELSFAYMDDKQYLMMVDKDPLVLFMVSTDTVLRFMRHADVFRTDGY
ncbi:MAG: DUF4340 domain-containing protein [Candidatus Cloacimonas sp.]|jgi:hypothetical protein|nr:DUF4340 domain-containing protein [Candidatus Cloacimonas sp.]